MSTSSLENSDMESQSKDQEAIKRLLQLYTQTSKHSHYQVLAKVLRTIIPVEQLNIVSRYERERMDYIATRLPIKDAVVTDIGGNTGYFSLECATLGAAKIIYCEGNVTHSAFVREAVHITRLDSIVDVCSRHILFQDDMPGPSDICLLLNVLHHVGDDYGDRAMSMDSAKKAMLNALHQVARQTQYMAFQMGYNWKGRRDLPLFEKGLKREQIDFIRQGTPADWDILHIGVAEEADGATVYRDLNDTNIARQDTLGEFRNRPLFIMRSRH